MLVACYGSLKKGFYNHRALGEAKFLGKSSVSGVMHWNGSYPKLYKQYVDEDTTQVGFPSDAERTHEVEVYDVSDENYQGIRAMELGSGYTEEEVETEWGPAKIYFMPHENFYDGDKWIEAYTLDLFNKN